MFGTRAFRCLLVAVVAILTTTVLPATAATAPAGQKGVDAQSSFQGPSAGPSSPGLKWRSERLNDFSLPRGQELVLDSAGHVLIQARHETETLAALNSSDGTIAWQVPDVVLGCQVAADDQGRIFAQLTSSAEGASNNHSDIVAIDAATGNLVAGMRWQPAAGEPRLAGCTDSLRLLEDGTLILVSRQFDTAYLWALDTTGSSIQLKWRVTYDGTERPLPGTFFGRPAISPDGSTVYTAWIDRSEPRQVHIDALDAATGALKAETTVAGKDVAGARTLLVDPGGHVVIATTDFSLNPRESYLIRVNGTTLGEMWQVTIRQDDDSDVYPREHGYDTLVSSTNNQIVGFYDGSLIVGIDLADGSAEWTVESGSFSNNESRLVSDAAGTTYWSTFGSNYIETARADGQTGWTLPGCSVEVGEAAIVGPVGPDGTLYTAQNVPDDGDGTKDVQVFAIASGHQLPQGTCEPQPTEERLGGANRYETAVAISQDTWADGSANAVVLARADVFADALAGTPLAVDKQAPLLITLRDELLPVIRDEIRRVLGNDTSKTVYLLGGPAALSSSVESSVRALGYRVVRLAGDDRIETAVKIAEQLSEINAFLVTTGYNFPDALAAGPAAANIRGAVLLSINDRPADATTAFMNARSSVPRYAVGGPAARAYPNAKAVFGQNRTESAIAVANEFFDSPPIVGISRADDFPDSLAGGAHIATGLPELGRRGGPIMLVQPTSLPAAVSSYLCNNHQNLERAFVYGGSAAISNDVASAVDARVDGKGC